MPFKKLLVKSASLLGLLVNLFLPISVLSATSVFDNQASGNILNKAVETSENLLMSAESPQVKSGWAEWLTRLPSGVGLHNNVLLNQLYISNQMQFFWQNRQARYLFQQQLAEVALAGIHPQFGLWVKWLAHPDLDDISRDLLLSDALLGYSRFVTEMPANGRRWLYGIGELQQLTPLDSDIERWQHAVKNNTLESFIANLVPQHPHYVAMNSALKKLLNDSDQRPWPKLSDNVNLKTGGVSRDIAMLREILIRTGMFDDNRSYADSRVPVVTTLRKGDLIDDDVDQDFLKQQNDTAVVDTVKPLSNTHETYDEKLSSGVKRFQEWHGLQPDGVVGVRTRQWLNVTPQLRAGLLALNIQRLRILPAAVENGILVNIPDYSMVFYRDGKPALVSRVIVGSPRRKTPLMENSLLNVVINPPWNVPTKLIRQDIVPKIKQDPSYLHRMNYTLYSSWENDSHIINPDTIDWRTVSASSFPYRIRQAPGSNNSLGRYKFNMPNSEAIYLHDTPNHSLFNKDIRALSSGCVRVNKAAELASMLLQEVGWNSGKISSTLQAGKTTYVSIRQQIPVDLYYLTVWMGEKGVPQYRTDIYNYDDMAQRGEQTAAQAKVLLQ